MDQRRIIGLDYGEKRVGIAIADPLRMFAQPVATVSPEDSLKRLDELASEDGIAIIVLGWPVLPDATEGQATERVRNFKDRLERRFPGVEIVQWEEEYTSEVAKELIAGGAKPSMKATGRGRIDAAAASIILQEFLDQREPNMR